MKAKKILIIDDEVKLAELAKMRLESHGYQVKILGSSKKAIEVIKADIPDLILLDVMMPYKDGYQLRDEIKSEECLSAIPIIFISARQSEQEIEEDSRNFTPVDGYIIKPYLPEVLLEKIETVLKKK